MARTKTRITLTTLAIGLAGLAVALTANTLAHKPPVMVTASAAGTLPPSSPVANILAEAVRIQTISYDDRARIDYTQHEAWAEFLVRSFPLAHSRLKHERIATYSHLYTWEGANPNLPPLLLTGHFDVVPVEEDSHGDWQQPPFAGTIADGYVWGRGAMDDKAAVISILAAAETLLQSNFVPQRSLIFAFGHDEEIGGRQGAAALAAVLRERGVKPGFMLDEGMPIADGILAGVSKPVAMIGIAEKGYLNLELSARASGGHSSSPPQHTAVGIVSRAIARLEANPMPVRWSVPLNGLFDTVMHEMPLPQRVVLANRWLFAPLLEKQLSAKPSTNAMLRTTAAATMFRGSPKENVLPARAAATVNFRVLPGDRIDDVIAHVKRVIDDPQVEVTVSGDYSEGSAVSSIDDVNYALVARSIQEVFPEVVVAPALLIATTDTRHYSGLTPNIYRFRPMWLKPEDISRFHGGNERLSLANLDRYVGFFQQLMRNAAHDSLH